MSDNTIIQQPATAGDTISTEDIGGGIKLPRSKIVIGAHAVDGGDVSVSNPLPATIINTPNVAVTNTPNVAVTNTPNVAVTNTPNVAVTNTPNVAVTNITHDTVSSLPYQVVKILSGPTSVSEGLVSSSNPMPVNIQNNVNVSPLGTESLSGSSSWAQRVKIITGASGVDGGDLTPSNPLPIFPAPVIISNGDISVQSSANVNAVVTYSPSEEDVMQVIGGVAWSYSGSGTMNGELSITDHDSNVVFQIDITNLGPGFIKFEPPISTGAGNGFVITLIGGGSSIIGKVNVLSHWTV